MQLLKQAVSSIRLKRGDTLFIEKLNAEAEQTVNFDKVVAVGTDNGLTVGAPYVENAVVEAKVLKNSKGKRKLLFLLTSLRRVKRRSRGHRQPYTQVKIEAIKA